MTSLVDKLQIWACFGIIRVYTKFEQWLGRSTSASRCMGCDWVWLSCQLPTCIMNTTYALATVWWLWYQPATLLVYTKHTYRCVCMWCQIQDEVKSSVSTTVDVSKLMSCTLNCTILNAVSVINFNVASLLCEKITEQLLAGLTSCLLSLVSCSTCLQRSFRLEEFSVTVLHWLSASCGNCVWRELH